MFLHKNLAKKKRALFSFSFYTEVLLSLNIKTKSRKAAKNP